VFKETTKIGRRGTIVIPATLRRRLGLKDGDILVAEEVDGGVLLRPAVAIALETYSPERRAEFLLNNAVDRDDYARAVREVRDMGVDPDAIAHTPPTT
jgi:AbrB family looped-hinge helix DNA binding protein